MSAAGEIAAGAASAVTGAAWKGATALMLVLLAGSGVKWGLAVHDLRQVQADLMTERGAGDALRDLIREQNRAVSALAAAKASADARGAAARVQAATAGRRYDAALAQLASARATTCAEAMPAVNQLLESVR